ncbi:hypothetical protein LSG31_15655 [Fodinisporobacter ferrooxydans]|uniref:Uncharacterized protein n=1 Tax=Fodinisporobacter ferrooxydans TaxID=2901836 RepID=A0ABY4CFM3_9BACL|nr:hypothetical protein LSG31_15655 [Alicyclobacillaceae bacterium MYW30-H2]
MSRKLRMTVQNESFSIGTIKLNSVSNASTVVIGDSCLVTPQTDSISQPLQQPQVIAKQPGPTQQNQT